MSRASTFNADKNPSFPGNGVMPCFHKKLAFQNYDPGLKPIF